MSAEIYIDPEAARKLVASLARTDTRAFAAVDRLSTARLAQHWRDAQFDRFQERLARTKLFLETFRLYSAQEQGRLEGDIERAEAIRRLG